ncbi:hypothetical protein, conserved in T. vivax [Trypanosoma vivax Y486]|uniref:Uncharacterized protein n=1 Tax=Trypanosoma vivax (strain Y486) TaxID=1055687 RepID=F9WQ95_TRYVY|nr:hypothetical protein, conserved in T. vivax [Trypanosoma vivax Y486]|eukprot:CCD19722.1 hypothetical protein, conserved in T. vivax [Trypanosoma vivax Y486]
MQRHRHKQGGMVYAKGKWESDGHAKALTEALAAFNSQWTTSNGKAVSAGSSGAACPLAKVGASGGAGYTAGKITFAGMFTAKTSSGLALLFKGSEKAGLDDVQALITRLTQLTTLADTGLQHRKFLCVPSTDTTEHTTDATGLAKAAAAIYDELQAREAAAKARRHTPKEQGKGEQHATASPSATERKAEEGSSQARSEPMEKQTAARRTAAQTRVQHVPGTPCSQRAQQQRRQRAHSTQRAQKAANKRDKDVKRQKEHACLTSARTETDTQHARQLGKDPNSLHENPRDTDPQSHLPSQRKGNMHTLPPKAVATSNARGTWHAMKDTHTRKREKARTRARTPQRSQDKTHAQG